MIVALARKLLIALWRLVYRPRLLGHQVEAYAAIAAD
jgi:hypothetical protein